MNLDTRAFASGDSTGAPLLRVTSLKKYFPVKSGFLARVTAWVKAVDDVSFDIYPGETLGLVGESGCGKTTAGRSLLRLVEPTSGDVLFQGRDVLAMKSQELRRLRRDMQIIFQDPYSSLNPRMTVANIVGEAVKVHGLSNGLDRERVLTNLMHRVGLSPAHLQRYSHEFSGGQRQRIGIARALALGPKLIVCDEPVSALDVSIQAQIINLLNDLQSEYHLAYLFISHDLNVIQHVADRMAVMYLGKIVETADTTTLFSAPKHPYTQALLAANPIPDPEKNQEIPPLEGDVPSPLNPPAGCYFHTRCSSVMNICRQVAPPTVHLGEGHRVACHLYEEATGP